MTLLPPEWSTSCPAFCGTPEDPVLALAESSGPNAADLLAAAKTALEDSKTRVRLILADDHRNAERAQLCAGELATSGVKFVVGHYGSLTARPASRIYGEAGVLYCAPGTSAPDLCGDQAPTTLQFFGTDLEQAECFSEAASDAGALTLILAQKSNYGATLGRTLFERLAHSHTRLQVSYLDIGRPPSTATLRAAKCICVLGSQEFCSSICRLYGDQLKIAEVLLSDDNFSADPNKYGEAAAALKVAFLTEVDDVLLDQSAVNVRARAEKVLGRAPGAYFDTSYLAIRALAAAWLECDDREVPRIRSHILAGRLRTPFGLLRFDAAGRMHGHTWSMRLFNAAKPGVMTAAA